MTKNKKSDESKEIKLDLSKLGKDGKIIIKRKQKEEAKKKLEKELEQSGLEEDIIEAEEVIDTAQLQNFLFSPSKAPILERTDVQASRPRFWQTPGQIGPEALSNGDDDPWKYRAGAANQEEIKYVSNSASITTSADHMDISEVGRTEFRPKTDQLFTQSSEKWDRSSPSVERYMLADRFDTEQAGRKDPLKREDKKYDFKLPK